jgi:hypothetical protein
MIFISGLLFAVIALISQTLKKKTLIDEIAKWAFKPTEFPFK